MRIRRWTHKAKEGLVIRGDIIEKDIGDFRLHLARHEISMSKFWDVVINEFMNEDPLFLKFLNNAKSKHNIVSNVYQKILVMGKENYREICKKHDFGLEEIEATDVKEMYDIIKEEFE